MLCVFGVFLTFVAMFISLLFIPFVTVHCKINFLVNFYWANKCILILTLMACIQGPPMWSVLVHR